MSGNVENIFTREAFISMFVFINNSIPSNDTTRQVIDTSIVSNPRLVGGTWKYDEPWPIGKGYQVPPGGELASLNRGWTYIRGQLYQVDDSEQSNQRLIPTSDSTGYKIQDVNANKFDIVNVVGVLVPTTTGSVTTWTFKYLKRETLDSLTSYCLDDNIANAKQFPMQDDPQTTIDDTANGWIERFFGAA